MAIARSRVTAQGQIFVPAEVRKKLGVGPGSVLEWHEQDDQVVVRRAARYTSQDIHDALFPQDMLLNHKELTLQDAEVVTSALEYFRRRPVIGFSDCLVVELARKAGHMPLGTVDRDLAKVDGVQRLKY